MTKSQLFSGVEAAYNAALLDERFVVNYKFAGTSYCEELFLTMLGQQGVGHIRNAAGSIAILGDAGVVYLWWGMCPEFLDDHTTWREAYICRTGCRDYIEFAKHFKECSVNNYADLAGIIREWIDTDIWNDNIN